MSTDFFENLGKTLTEKAKSVGERTDEFIAIQKLRSQQSSLESEVKKNYKVIGEMVYQKFLKGEPYGEDIVELCQEIIQLQSEIAECKETIANKRGKNICPACGASAPREADFCMKCGSAIPKPEETEDAKFEDAEDIFEEDFAEEADEDKSDAAASSEEPEVMPETENAGITAEGTELKEEQV